jgi:hypothetical protein
MKLINNFLVKKVYCVKRQDFFPNTFWKNELFNFYGLDMEPEP